MAHGEADMIADSLRSAIPYIDRVVVLDTVFPSNPIKEWTPDQRQVVESVVPESMPLTYTEEREGWSERDARNGLLTLVSGKDWVLVLDADEILVGDHQSLLELAQWVRSGAFNPQALGLSVYTEAVLFNGDAPAMSEEEYATNPLIHTVGVQPRLFQQMNHQYRLHSGDRTPALFYKGEVVGSGVLLSEGFILNRRAHQSWEAYQNDYRWETDR